jgi:hypothetical protein
MRRIQLKNRRIQLEKIKKFNLRKGVKLIFIKED